MNFIFSAILGVIAYFLFPLEGFSFSFSDMATVTLLCFLGALLSFIMAISVLFKK